MHTNPIFNVTNQQFVANAAVLWQHQRQHCSVLANWVHAIQYTMPTVPKLSDFRFLPISFFKTHQVTCLPQLNPQHIFTSSGTTGMAFSSHLVYNLQWYRTVCIQGWQQFYGNPSHWDFYCLLPAYMERTGSSLIYMMQELVALNNAGHGGFYLNASQQLANKLQESLANNRQVVLMGVTFALLDFAENFALKLPNLIIMETGGMKGRRKEMTRNEVHDQLKSAFGVENIAAEYGMTELMSQAYSNGKGIFTCPPWMRVLVRDPADPFGISETGSGILCIIDLANQDSCAFIETEDIGTVYADGSFEVQGRIDNSDARGCNLLVV